MLSMLRLSCHHREVAHLPCASSSSSLPRVWVWGLRSLLAISTMGSLMNKNEILHEHCSSTDDTRNSGKNCLQTVRALPNTYTWLL